MDSLDNLFIRGGRLLGVGRISESGRDWMALCHPYAATTSCIRGFGQWPATAPRPQSPHRRRVGGSRHGRRWSSCGLRVFLERPLIPARSGDGAFRTLFPVRGLPTSRMLCGSLGPIGRGENQGADPVKALRIVSTPTPSVRRASGSRRLGSPVKCTVICR